MPVARRDPTRPWWRLVLGFALFLLTTLAAPGLSAAAEVLQVRGPTLLQVGDSNRSYSVQLACLTVNAGQEQEALAWLRHELPRHSRVNLRPLGHQDGILIANVRKLSTAVDLGGGLIGAGLASATGCAA